MIKINTRDFGEIEIEEDKIFDFPVGLFAFEDAKRFALINPLGENVYPMWLQCTDSISPCFIVFDPTTIDENYRVSLTPIEENQLKIKENTKVRCLCIAKVPEDYRNTTVNMKSPIIVNIEQKIAMQVILPHEYPFRYPIYQSPELDAEAAEVEVV